MIKTKTIQGTKDTVRKKIIRWIDSNIIDEQTDVLPIPAIIETIGFERCTNGDYTVIARDKIGDEYRGQIAIPRLCILETKNL